MTTYSEIRPTLHKDREGVDMTDSQDTVDTQRNLLNQVATLVSLRTLRWRWIALIGLCEWVAISLVLILIPINISAVFWVFAALFGGWQLGCVSERNDWHTPVNDLVNKSLRAIEGSSNPQKETP